jgi:ribosome-associated protein
MKTEELKDRIPESELLFSASKSSGPGGQNVNKVNTRAEIRFNILTTTSLTQEEKEIILNRLSNRINSAGEIIITSGRARSQLKNRESATEKMFMLLASALTENPERKPTLPTIKSKVERLEKKKKRSNLKKLRKDPGQSTLP